MTNPTRLNLDEFPDSPYADELRGRGLSLLRFAPPVERAFIRSHLERMHLRVRIWSALAFAILLASLVHHIVTQGPWAGETVVHYCLTPLFGLLAWIAWSPAYRRHYLPAAQLLMPLISCVSPVLAAQSASLGRAEELIIVATHIVSVFFLSGLLLRAAAFTSALMLISFALAAAHFGLPTDTAVRASLLLLLMGTVAGIVAWDTEKSHRLGFLEGGLINELAARDGLTRLKNRRTFDEHLPRVWQQAARDRRSLAILLIDVDHFKSYNDFYGHQAGDEVLRRIARLVQSAARRPLDLAARYGGEEFVLILYDYAPELVVRSADRLRQDVAELGIEHGAAPTGPVVTVSIGIAIVEPTPGRSPLGAVQLADAALYQAKADGRNRVRSLGPTEHKLVQTGVFVDGRLRRPA